ncbi:tropomyosin-like [Daphnia pulicaria]|uniref:tropomyosin-like n=1 Tax=Daphnia pulicaria TaxID=35523 RepID=UPI001EEA592C|nr:tropomyosin-like [Daphnia pulicaria]
MESKDEEIVRIVNCINSCWPEYPFTYADIRKPTGEKFRDVLSKFLQGFLGCNYQYPAINMHKFSSNPEMFVHLEGNLSLFRTVNRILKELGYHNFKYGDMIKPTSNTVKDVFVCLVNFLAYFEAEEATKEEAEAEIQKLKQQTVQYEKRLLEDEKYLSKCQQNDEEKKIQVTELRQVLVSRKENFMKIEAHVKKMEGDVDNLTKRINNINTSLEKAVVTLKQVDQEKEKATEAVVEDPEALEAELLASQDEKEAIETDFSSIKNRLPALEQQIQDRTLQFQEHKETHQRLAQVKARESKLKLEWHTAEADYRRVDDEKQLLENNVQTDLNLIESKKRMLVECEQKVEHLREQLEKTRSDVKQCLSEDDCRKAQMEARIIATENEISRLRQDLKLSQKVLDEGAAVLEAIYIKHQRDKEQMILKHDQLFEKFETSMKKCFPQ